MRERIRHLTKHNMNYRAQRVSSSKFPKEYAFSCFDNAVRFAYYFSKNQPEKKWFVVGGHNHFGVHYGFLSVDSEGNESLNDFDDKFVNGVEVRIPVRLAVDIRNELIKNDNVRVSPDADVHSGGQDVLVALAPSIDDVLSRIEHD